MHIKKIHRLVLGAGLWILGANVAFAQVRTEATPKELEKVGVTEHLGVQVPLALPFVNAAGEATTLGHYFGHGRPVLLTLNYSDCPMLCNVQLEGFAQSIKKLEWTLAKEFDVVTVSIEPEEKPERALESQTKYLKQYGRSFVQSDEGGWHFLTGTQESITALAESVGFRYTYLPDEKEYAHSAVVMVLSPEGKLSRYLYGVMYDSQTLRLSLVEAAAGKIGSTLDRVLLFCFHYDAEKGRYAPVARNMMRAGGALTVLVLVAWVGGYLVRESRKKKSSVKR